MRSLFNWGLPRAIHGSDSAAYLTGVKESDQLLISSLRTPCLERSGRETLSLRTLRLERAQRVGGEISIEFQFIPPLFTFHPRRLFFLKQDTIFHD